MSTDDQPTPNRRLMMTDLHVKLDEPTMTALKALQAAYLRRGVVTSRSSMARLAISMAAANLTMA